ncbi:preprotein translocase subunit SecY [Candidatus Woesearchaeota archaeon]|nr:preprotein translocase subunit SecY [Candidatus Woesearchaeota archaeon]MBW3017434.1 preprotein translocase subunit SecY [Candidatus Woesearchaeota archaeon]
MGIYQNIIENLPEVKGPTQRRLSFKEKLKWTLISLVLFYILGLVSLFGLDPQYQFRFDQLALILGAKFGSIISLGIGPIVTASIVLQLLNGSGILKFDLTTPEGKKTFQGTQKLLAIFFVIFEAGIYVFMGGLSPNAALAGTPAFFTVQMLLIFQLTLGGLLIMFMDEVVSKWGFGSGISLFIVAGVANNIFVQAFSPLNSAGKWAFGSGQAPIGQVWAFFVHIAENNPTDAGLAIAAIVSTVIVFALSVYTQAMKIDIPLSFGRVRGYGMRWPLRFIYTSNIPVILVAALMANVQLWARLLQNWGLPILGTFVNNQPATGLASWLEGPNIVRLMLTGTFSFFPVGKGFMYALSNSDMLHSLVYIIFMMIGAVVFSIFWVQTSGMDSRSVAKQIMASGLSIPGFRKDLRILESILQRYIGPLTVMGALAVGFLAASADLTGALSRGTGILLSVMIIYKMYEDIAKQHMMDMHPMMRRFME